jgi:hypothetical protein
LFFLLSAELSQEEENNQDLRRRNADGDKTGIFKKNIWPLS